MQQFRPSGFQILPTVVKNLLISNGVMFLATMVIGPVYLKNLLGLHYFTSPMFRPYQLITHMFMHENFTHIFFNMFALWVFGPMVESVWGPKRFLLYYLVCGLGAAFCQLGVNGYMISQIQDPELAMRVANGYMIGASGAIFGVLLAFGMLFPNVELYVYALFPVKAKYLVTFYGIIELVSGVKGYESGTDNVAHFAHLGGMLFGFILIKYWNRNRRQNFF